MMRATRRCSAANKMKKADERNEERTRRGHQLGHASRQEEETVEQSSLVVCGVYIMLMIDKQIGNNFQSSSFFFFLVVKQHRIIKWQFKNLITCHIGAALAPRLALLSQSFELLPWEYDSLRHGFRLKVMRMNDGNNINGKFLIFILCRPWAQKEPM